MDRTPREIADPPKGFKVGDRLTHDEYVPIEWEVIGGFDIRSDDPAMGGPIWVKVKIVDLHGWTGKWPTKAVIDSGEWELPSTEVRPYDPAATLKPWTR